MTDTTTRSRRSAGHAGLFNGLLAVTSALVDFFRSRGALVAAESKAALVQCVILAICLLAAVMLFVLGYIFLVAGAIVGIAHAMQISWICVALTAALVHFVFGLFCLLIARTRMTKPMFRNTSAELKKDAEWLKTLNTTSQPKS
jgi:uncharacterized membrane protein YqjE